MKKIYTYQTNARTCIHLLIFIAFKPVLDQYFLPAQSGRVQNNIPAQQTHPPAPGSRAIGRIEPCTLPLLYLLTKSTTPEIFLQCITTYILLFLMVCTTDIYIFRVAMTTHILFNYSVVRGGGSNKKWNSPH